MSDIAPRIDIDGIAGLLVSQWRDAPRLQALVHGLLELVNEELTQPLAQVELLTNLDATEGHGLDDIGERLGMPRPGVIDADFKRFGFSGSGGVGFDQAPFASTFPQLAQRIPVGDAYYRRLLRARGVWLRSDASTPSLEAALRHIFPDAAYQDNQDMTLTVTYTESLPNLDDIAREAGAIPRPAGVALTIDVLEGG